MAFSRFGGSKRHLTRVQAGDDLAREFVAALNNRMVVMSLKQVAEENEQHTLDSLAHATARNKVFIAPQNIPLEQHSDIAKESLNAHMQKVQALQAEDFNNGQQQTKNKMLLERYKGRKIVVRVISRHHKPVITYWNDSLTGKRHGNGHAPQRLAGIIENIDLSGNTITVRPSALSKSLNRSVMHHEVYIVNPDDMTPLVYLKIY